MWTEEKIEELKIIDNKWSRVNDVLFLHVKEGYIIKFIVEAIESYSLVEETFEVGPRKSFLERILLWLKIRFVEKGLMKMNPNEMET